MQNWLPLIQETRQALARHSSPIMQQAAFEMGIEHPDLQIVWLAYTSEPESLSIAQIARRAPYLNPQIYAEKLQKAELKGWLRRNGDGGYHLTIAGEHALGYVRSKSSAQLAALELLASEKLERLADLLQKLVSACLATPEPVDKCLLNYSRRCDQGVNTPPLVRIDQYLADLNFYHEDACHAAWRQLEIPGQTWETFTCLSCGEPTNLDLLDRRLTRRGYSRVTYARALIDLLRRGWAQDHLAEYRLTEQGEQIRQAIEDATNTCFYTPWYNLTQDEQSELWNTLVVLRNQLTGILEQAARQTCERVARPPINLIIKQRSRQDIRRAEVQGIKGAKDRRNKRSQARAARKPVLKQPAAGHLNKTTTVRQAAAGK
jgi:hypothetical protein